MFRCLRYLLIVVVILCGCAKHHESNTFRRKYNVYAEPEILDVNSEHHPLAVQWALPGAADALKYCDVPISTLADFVDAIVRRADAENLREYLAIQHQIDRLFVQLRLSVSYPRGKEKYGDWGYDSVFLEKEARLYLVEFYRSRHEHEIRDAVATVQYTRYILRETRIDTAE